MSDGWWLSEELRESNGGQGNGFISPSSVEFIVVGMTAARYTSSIYRAERTSCPTSSFLFCATLANTITHSPNPLSLSSGYCLTLGQLVKSNQQIWLESQARSARDNLSMSQHIYPPAPSRYQSVGLTVAITCFADEHISIGPICGLVRPTPIRF